MYKIINILFIIIIGVFSVSAQVLPLDYDLRNVNGTNYVTSVKSQQGGTCWTFGAMASIEGNLLMTNIWSQAGELGEPNLAEYHLDWWNGFNQFNNDDITPSIGNGLSVHNGGDYRVTAAYLSRGDGAVRNIDGQNFNSAPLRKDTSYHYFYPRNIEWYTAGPELERINTIKQKVVDYGVVGTCMSVGFWVQPNLHYQPYTSNTDPNHAVAIIGWSDTLQTTAHEKGAWLVKNSWGTIWGDSGYFWISYYDKHCGQEPQMGAISFQDVETMKYQKVFFHDYHGWRDELYNCAEGFNSFVNEDNFESIEAISFYNAADSVSFSSVIYGNYINGVLSDTLAAKSGFINHIGFHTFDLDSSIVISPNDSFYMYLDLSDGGQPYDRSSEVPVLLGSNQKNGPIIISSAELGQSYYRPSGSNVWLDLQTVDTTANFCMKALSNPQLPLAATIPIGDGNACSNDLESYYHIPPVDYTSSYDWILTPPSAGVIINLDTLIKINWAQGFIGSAKINVIPQNSYGEGIPNELVINVYPSPYVNIGQDTSIKASHSIILEAGIGFSNYLWSDGSIGNSLTVNGNSLSIGNNNIWVEVTDSNLCIDSDSLILTIMQDIYIEEILNAKIHIYPNPAQDILYIKIDQPLESIKDISIRNILGQEVFISTNEINFNGDEYSISLPKLENGIYLLEIYLDHQKITKKVIINQRQ